MITCFDEECTALGRILALFIALSFNVGSLRRWLVKTGGVTHDSKSLQSFENISSDVVMNDSNHLLSDIDWYPGLTVA